MQRKRLGDLNLKEQRGNGWETGSEHSPQSQASTGRPGGSTGRRPWWEKAPHTPRE